MLKCRISQNLPRGWYDIWFYTDKLIWYPDGRYESYEQGTEPNPSMTLTGDALEALLAEAEKVIPASHATERHLNDAISVRDKLLALVEKRH